MLAEAIDCGGTTISDFRAPDGSEGHFAVRLLVYGREGADCPPLRPRPCGPAARPGGALDLLLLLLPALTGRQAQGPGLAGSGGTAGLSGRGRSVGRCSDSASFPVATGSVRWELQ